MIGGADRSGESPPAPSVELEVTRVAAERPPAKSGEVPLAELAPGTLLNDKYEVLTKIGRGGMATVFAARHRGLDTTVAIKVMHGDRFGRGSSMQRFLREAKAAAALKSDHAVRIHDVDRLPSGLPFIVMELLEGTDLAAYVRDQQPSVADAVDWTLEAASAIAEAHGNGLIHRDIKPHNLFLARRPDGSDRIKVLDFGLVKLIADDAASLTTSSDSGGRKLLGSPHFMSPEQIRSSSDVDVRTDVWSLGATLYYLLAGAPPFDGPTTHALLARILVDPARDVRELRPDVPEELARIVARCLVKDPEGRFRSMTYFLAALRAFATAPTPSRPSSRQRLFAMAADVLSVAAALATAASSPQRRRSARPPRRLREAPRPDEGRDTYSSSDTTVG